MPRLNSDSLQRTWAWLITSLVFFIAANLLPLLINSVLGQEEAHTIIEGIVIFLEHGDYLVAFVILTASLIIPILKLLTIAYIALSIQFNWKSSIRPRVMLYKAVEFIGRWSMIDVFVVALLASLIQLGGIIAIKPGPGTICFALSVVFAMFSAGSIDSKLIFEHSKGPQE